MNKTYDYLIVGAGIYGVQPLPVWLIVRVSVV